MSSFEERVQRIVSERTDEMLELFQSSEHRTCDLEDKINALVESIPLIRDIKTEVSRIEKRTVPNGGKEDKDKDDESPQDEEPPKGEDLTDLMELIEDLSHHYLSDKTVKQLLLDGPAGAPALLDPGGDGINFTPMDALRLIQSIWRWIKNMRKAINEGVEDALHDSSMRVTQGQIDYINKTINIIEKYLKDSVSTDLSDIKEALENCCSQTSETLDDIVHQIGSVQQKVDQLGPASAADKDLSLQTKTKAILSEIQSIRGLL